jgi:hypothetical protein
LKGVCVVVGFENVNVQYEDVIEHCCRHCKSDAAAVELR